MFSTSCCLFAQSSHWIFRYFVVIFLYLKLFWTSCPVLNCFSQKIFRSENRFGQYGQSLMSWIFKTIFCHIVCKKNLSWWQENREKKWFLFLLCQNQLFLTHDLGLPSEAELANNLYFNFCSYFATFLSHFCFFSGFSILNVWVLVAHRYWRRLFLRGKDVVHTLRPPFGRDQVKLLFRPVPPHWPGMAMQTSDCLHLLHLP